jgi:2',3'-cyclic-nucleotide 2'-phosphodiesterase (5'-nucleotidase family)
MPKVGGVARRATLIKDERAAGDAVLVVDAGDSLIGDMEPAMSTEGASSVEAMNRMGYDAVLLAPADLSLGPEILKQRIAEAKFPFLSADMAVAATGAAVAEGLVVREVGGRRVAIAGISAAPEINGFTAADPFETAQRVAQQASDAKAEGLILLSHAAPEVNERIADEIAGIAAIVEGGSLPRAEPWISAKTGTPIYHADWPSSGHAGRVVGVATLRLDEGKLLSEKWRSVPLDPEIKDDPEMAAWAQQQPR